MTSLSHITSLARAGVRAGGRVAGPGLGQRAAARGGRQDGRRALGPPQRRPSGRRGARLHRTQLAASACVWLSRRMRTRVWQLKGEQCQLRAVRCVRARGVRPRCKQQQQGADGG
eukprot:3100732-Rhodomonas_salina.1